MLPPPHAIQNYERRIENARKRHLRLVETELAHRHALKRKIDSSDVFRANVGLIARILMAVGVCRANLAATALLIGGSFLGRKGS